jgi:hypothetical protein
LAQVHVSRIQYDSAVQQYARADQAYEIESRLARTTASRQESDAQSVLDRISSETSAIAAELRLYQTFAQSQSALGQMQAAMGLEVVPASVPASGIEELSAEIGKRLLVMDQGIVSPDDVAPGAAVPVRQ